MSRATMQQALDALECVRLDSLVPDYGSGHWSVDRLDEKAIRGAKDALRAALAEPDTAPNLACKSVQKRLATQWGYVLAEPRRQPLTDERAANFVQVEDSPMLKPVAMRWPDSDRWDVYRCGNCNAEQRVERDHKTGGAT